MQTLLCGTIRRVFSWLKLSPRKRSAPLRSAPTMSSFRRPTVSNGNDHDEDDDGHGGPLQPPRATSFDLNLVEASFQAFHPGLWARNRYPSRKTERIIIRKSSRRLGKASLESVFESRSFTPSQLSPSFSFSLHLFFFFKSPPLLSRRDFLAASLFTFHSSL